MHSRLELHNELVSIAGGNKVYYQPPETLKLTYPCIIYSLSERLVTSANDAWYTTGNKYKITVVDSDPESTIAENMCKLAGVRHVQRYAANDMYHDVFTITLL